MKFILLLLTLALAASADEPLLTKHYRILNTTFYADKANGGKNPELKDGLEGEALTRTIDARSYMEARGVTFPAGAKAHYHRAANLLVVTNTAANLNRTAEIVRVQRFDSKSIRVEVVLAEIPPEAQAKLRSPTTLDALQKEFGPRIKLLCTTGVTTRSGNRAVTEMENAENLPPPAESTETGWPPPKGVERTLFEVEAIAAPDGESVDMQFSFRHAAPAGRGQPPILVTLVSNILVPDSLTLTVKSFTLRDQKTGPRHYAVLVGSFLLDARSRTFAKAREESDRQLLKK